MRINKIIILYLFITLVPVSGAVGQIVYDQPYSTDVAFYYTSWSLDNPVADREDEISQRTVSLSGFIPLRDNFEARYSMITASNTLDMNNTESELAGLGDVRVQLSHSFSRDRLLFSAGLNLPTGKQELDTDDEIQVVDFLSRDYLSLPLRRYGEGLGFNLMAGGATRLGAVKCGLTASYQHTGTYQPYNSYGDYNPGNHISLGANANFALNKIDYSVQCLYSVSGTDQLDDADIYKQAPQFITQLSATYSGEPYRTTLGTRIILRGRNTRYSLADGVIESQLKKYGDEYDFFLRFDYTPDTSWRIGVHAATRQISSGEEALDHSSIYNAGLDVSRKVSENLNLNIGGIFYIGSTDLDDISISGFQTTASLSVAY